MAKKFTVIVVVLALAILAVAVGKNVIARNLMTAGVRIITGLTVAMESMDVGVLSTAVDIKGLKLLASPARFPESLVVDMPELYVDYDLGAFLQNRIHLERVKIDLRELVIVKNSKGELNLESVKQALSKKSETQKQAQAKGKKAPEFKIDVLEIKIGKVVYKDYSQGTPPKVSEFNVNIAGRFENVTDPYAVSSVVVVKALMNTTIAKLANFDIAPFKEEIAGAIQRAGELVQGAAEEALRVGKEMGERAQEAAGEAVKGAAEKLKGLVPFGK